MISPTRAASNPPGADLCPPVSQPAAFSTWHNIGDVAEKALLAVWDAANRAKDRQDEALDAMRVSNGMTLDEFLAGK
jgi:hypothetical protein